MFGKRPQPKTFHVFTNTPAKNEDDKLIFEYGILIRNEGPGIATDLFLTSVISSTIGESSELSWKPSDPATWTGSVSFGNHISIILKKDIRLPPESQLQPLTLKCELLPPFTEPLKISGSVGCSGAPSYKFEITSSVDEIQAIYDEYFVKLSSNELTKSICHELSSRLFSA